MKAEDIKHIIKRTLKHIITIFREFRKLPNVWMYVALSAVLIVLFLLLTFPYAALIRNGLQTAGENIGRSASIGKINFSLTGGASIESMTIILKNGSELTFQNANIDTGIFSALVGKSVNGDLKINNIKLEKDKMSVNAVAGADFNLKFNTYSELPAGGRARIELQNVIAGGINVKDFDIPPVRFTSVAANLNIANKKITIEDFIFTGPDLKGNISGTLTVAKFFPQSQLNLNLTVDSSSPFLENYRILLGQWIDETNNIRLSIRGSISNPRLDTSGQKNKAGTGSPGSFDEDIEAGPEPGNVTLPRNNNTGKARATARVPARRTAPQAPRNVQTGRYPDDEVRDVRENIPGAEPDVEPATDASVPDESFNTEEEE